MAKITVIDPNGDKHEDKREVPYVKIFKKPLRSVAGYEYWLEGQRNLSISRSSDSEAHLYFVTNYPYLLRIDGSYALVIIEEAENTEPVEKPGNEATEGAKEPEKPVHPNLLEQAEKLTSVDRQDVYGHPVEDFQRTADMWSGYLGLPRNTITPMDVAQMMILVKASRIRNTVVKGLDPHFDSHVDQAGYAKCGWMCAEILQPLDPFTD